jgi:hypothetical protein
MVKGYLDWHRRRDVPAASSLIAVQAVTVPPNSNTTLVEVEGKGSLTGLTVTTLDWSSLVNCWLLVTVDGAQYQLCYTGIAGPIVNSGAPYNSRSTPFTVLNIDFTNKKAGVSLTVPIRFSKSLKVEYRNATDTVNHNIDYILSVDLEQ